MKVVAAAPEIRPAQARDLVAIRAIATAAYQPYVARMGREPAPMAADFPGHIDRFEAFVLEADDAVAAYIVTFIKDNGQFIENVAVDPSWHGKGLGRKLMSFAEVKARDRGVDRLTLYTNIHMTENLDFYPRLGYVETHRTTEDGFERVYFEKRL